MEAAWGGSWVGSELRPLIQTFFNLDHCNKFCIQKSAWQNETTRRGPLVWRSPSNGPVTPQVLIFFCSYIKLLCAYDEIWPQFKRVHNIVKENLWRPALSGERQNRFFLALANPGWRGTRGKSQWRVAKEANVFFSLYLPGQFRISVSSATGCSGG
jgi:hypothetical protein